MIGVATPIMLRPTIIGTKFHKGKIVGHQIRTKHVAFVDHRPQASAAIPIEANGVTQTDGIWNFFVLGDVIFEHHRAAIFGFYPMFSNVAV